MAWKPLVVIIGIVLSLALIPLLPDSREGETVELLTTEPTTTEVVETTTPKAVRATTTTSRPARRAESNPAKAPKKQPSHTPSVAMKAQPRSLHPQSTVKPPGTTTSTSTSMALQTPVTAMTKAPLEASASRAGWILADSEDYHTLDPTKWGLYDGIGNGGVGWRRPSQVSVADGLLTITGTKANLTGGGLADRTGHLYGRWEWRVRVDAGTGWGPAIMLWPDSGVWPDDGEIDVMESPGGAHDFVVSTLHWGATNEQRGVDTALDATEWQTYAVEWLPERVTFFVNDAEVLNVTDPEAIPSTPFHVAMQLDVGAKGEWIPAPDALTPDAVRLQVDWVKRYTR